MWWNNLKFTDITHGKDNGIILILIDNGIIIILKDDGIIIILKICRFTVTTRVLKWNDYSERQWTNFSQLCSMTDSGIKNSRKSNSSNCLLLPKTMYQNSALEHIWFLE